MLVIRWMAKRTAEHNAKISAALRGKHKGKPVWNKGLTKADARVAANTAHMAGREVSPITRAKIAAARSKGRVFYDACQDCGRPKGHSQRLRCVYCAARWRAAHYPNSMAGKPMREATRAALRAARSRQTKPTKPELAVMALLGEASPYRYTGCGADRFWITIPNAAERKARNPDFVSQERRQVIEVFGRYWHRNDSEQAVIEEYRRAGYDCLIIWNDAMADAEERLLAFARKCTR